VLDRLAKQGFAERQKDGRFLVLQHVPKRALKTARARRA
jgi:hypothetical protein